MTSVFPIESFDRYWQMWNNPDVSRARASIDIAVTEDFVFCDPLHEFTGRDGLEDNVRTFRSEWPHAIFQIVSGVDTHHNRFRYRWDLFNNGNVIVNGLDIATVGPDGLIERIDGFFGDVPAAKSHKP